MNSTETVLETHNIFIDTGDAQEESKSRGDDFQLHLNNLSIDADRGQFIRLNLVDFNMAKTFTDVNENNNNIFFSILTGIGTTTFNAQLTKRNYETVHDLAVEVADTFYKAFLTMLTGVITSGTTSALTPDATTSVNGTTNNIISFTLTFNTNHGLLIPPVAIFYSGKGDSYRLLGANRETTGSTIDSGITITTPTADSVKFVFLYPAQRATTSHLYLRTSLSTGATETAGMQYEDDIAEKDEALYSNILAKIPVNTEYCTYTQSSGYEYFIDLHQKHINNIKLEITDEKNRRLGRRPADKNAKTASGSGTEQSTLGNLSFSCVIRAEVIERQRPSELQFAVAQTGIPNNKETHPLIYPNRPGF
jgi:hypothetical protein